MDFDLSEDQREIQRTAKELLSARSNPEAVRRAAESRQRDESLWREVSELGWPGIAIAGEHGGQDLGLVELSVLLEQAGAALAPIPLLPSACAAATIAIAGSDEQQQRWLQPLASGQATGAIGMPGLIAGAPGADVIVVVEQDGSARLIDAGSQAAQSGSATVRELKSIDPLRAYCDVEGEGEGLLGDVRAAIDIVSVAIAAECVGVCQRALEMTVSYVKERKQFGVPVGSFQAVSHRCAEMLLHTESARSALYGAAWAADSDRERLPAAASLAKAVASEAVLSVTGSAIQAHGGIGFTWEADVHWLYKRAQLNAELMGGASTYRRRLAEAIGIAEGA